MKKTAVAALVLFVLSVTVSHVSAAPVDIQINPEEIRTDTDTEAIFYMTVKNNEYFANEIEVTVNGPYPWWVTTSAFYLFMDANSTEEVRITIFPTGNKRGRFPYDVSVSSKTTGATITKTIYVDIPEAVILHNFSTEKIGNELKIRLKIETLKKRKVSMVFDVMDSSGRLVTTFPDTVDIEGMETIERTIPLPENMLMGVYTVNVTISSDVLEHDIKQTAEFEVAAIHDVVKTTKKTITPLYEEVTVTLHNRGNVVEENYVVLQTTPVNLLTGFITKPAHCYEEGGDRICNYVIERIEPGGTAYISYRIEYWPVLIQYSIGIIIALIIIGFSFIRITKPTINKKYKKGGKNKHSIILEIKNPFRQHLNNVIVRDWVSPLAKVLYEEIEAVKPIIRKSEAGTELIWKLGNIKPKEIRLLNYKIKTFVEGSLKMPRAYMRFRTNKGKRTRVYSRPLVVS